MKILFACSEYHPLVRTDDVADFGASLTGTIGKLAHDVRIVLPAYPQSVNAARPLETVANVEFAGCDEPVRILQGTLAGHDIPVYLIEAQALFSRHGHPYREVNGSWRADNVRRFALFSQAVTMMALNHAGLNWRPDVVHCNDWQTGLVPALLAQDWNRPATVFTPHRLTGAHDLSAAELAELKLPAALRESSHCQVDGQFSPLLAGLAYADLVACSSIAFVNHLDKSNLPEAYQARFDQLDSRLAGLQPVIDESRFNPANDNFITQSYDASTPELKTHNKQVLQNSFGLEANLGHMLLTLFDEVTDYRDDDERLQLSVMEDLLKQPDVQLLICWQTPKPVKALEAFAAAYPGRVALCVQPSETDLHRLLAGSDAALFSAECQLTRLLPDACRRYGTVPVISSRVFANADIVDATADNLMRNQANTFLYRSTLAGDMLPVLERLLAYYRRTGPWWKKLVTTILQRQGGIGGKRAINTAQQYLEHYQYAIDNPASNPDQH